MNSDDKNKVLIDYNAGRINILISTSVIEVGINVLNATVMAIYNPERFGLSSLHQLRGRVGRGEKPGFCFLIPDSNTSSEGIKRLKVVERSHDGFEIAEADLKNRGEGDLFGSSQSGNISSNKVANIFEHFAILETVQRDVQKVKNTKPELFIPLLEKLSRDKKISTTV
jgi:ATP-dependent DNA helicase RecG